MISGLEDELTSEYEGRRRFFVPFSDLDRWALKFLGRDETGGHHYQLTEFRRKTLTWDDPTAAPGEKP